ncbi:uncharacterized protein DC041_0008667 [Schistosoma bovis]|uniref:V-SNARE coiled-coil homology domain-containing protein n=1 Tax=Schistosoma bovis TaxID=6184 RepID=A0A430Q0D9_SCHBO|nr:uncharacterized protein DC041_0008667 [Schistosoma bovis]
MTDKAPIKTNKRLQQTQAQVNEVVDIMRVNVDKVLERDKNLSELDGRADALQAGASQFEASAGKLKRKFWWKNCKLFCFSVFCRNKVEQSGHSSHHLVMNNTSHLLSEPVMMEHSREGKPILPDDHMIGSNEVNSGTPPSFNSNRIKSKGFEKLRSPPLSLPTSPSYTPSFSSYPSSSQHHFENNETSLF